MQEVRGFEPHRLHLEESLRFALGGLIAGEGSFSVAAATPPTRKDGSERQGLMGGRRRFIFSISMADRDRALLSDLKDLLGVGSLRWIPSRNGRWLPQVQYSIGSRLAHRLVTIPFMDEHLLASTKRHQFEGWRAHFESYERLHPTQIGLGPSECSEPGCDKPVRGRGLCRAHYYRATGY